MAPRVPRISGVHGIPSVSAGRFVVSVLVRVRGVLLVLRFPVETIEVRRLARRGWNHRRGAGSRRDLQCLT